MRYIYRSGYLNDYEIQYSKFTILRLEFDITNIDSDFGAINDDVVEILSFDIIHRNLGWKFIVSPWIWCDIELWNLKRQVWGCLNKHKYVELNHHISLKMRLKYFDSWETPIILLTLVILHILNQRSEEFDIAQHKILRSIVDWIYRRWGLEAHHDVYEVSYRENIDSISDNIMIGPLEWFLI